MIRSSSLAFNQANKGKIEIISLFLSEYRNAVEYYVNEYWNKTITNPYCLDLEKLKKKSFYPSTISDPVSKLSGRALKSAKTQAMGMINAATAKRYKQAYVLKQNQKKGIRVSNLQKKLSRTRLVKPSIPKQVNAEINSINCKFSKSSNSFDYWFDLTTMFNIDTKKEFGFNSVSIPLNSNKHLNKLISKGKVMNSFLIGNNSITVRVEIEEMKSNGTEVIAIDQGVTDLISIASSTGDGYTSSKCIHGHDMASIMTKMSRKQKGSNAFKKAQEHRKNYINWAINQLDLDRISELRLEKIHDMRRGTRTSRFLGHFSYPLIEQKLKSRCEESGVRFVLQSNEYRSQRCSLCGFVHKNNRKGKSFICKSCGETHDADMNAAENHLVDLPVIDRYAICGLNRTTGFFWNPEFDGVYSPINLKL